MTSHQAISQAREQILSRHLAWKRHITRRSLHWDLGQSHHSKNHQKTSQTMEVQLTDDGRLQWRAMGAKSITLQSTFHFAKRDINTKADSRQRHHNTGGGGGDISNAIEDQQPMEEEAASSKKQKVTIT